MELYLILASYLLVIVIESTVKLCKLNNCNYNYCDCFNSQKWIGNNIEYSTCHTNDTIIECLEIESEDFSNLKNLSNIFNKTIQISNESKIKIAKSKKFNINKSIQILNTSSSLYIASSIFKFENENGTEINKEICKLKNLKDFVVFKSINSLKLEINVQFKQKICPLIFLSSDILSVTLVRLTDSYIQTNKLRFLNTNNTNTILNLDSKISKFYSNLFQYKLDTELLNKDVFSNLNDLIIKGTILKVDKDTFNSMKSMKKLVFFLANLREFFHSGTEWFDSLKTNFNRSLSVSNLNFYEEELMKVYFLWDTVVSLDIYDYPDEDFCLFYKFPIERLIVPLVKPADHFEPLIECSCSIIWLFRYSKNFVNFKDKIMFYSNFYENLVYSNKYSYFIESDSAAAEIMVDLFDITTICIINDTVNEFLKCNFTQRITQCNKSIEIYGTDKETINMINLTYVFLYARYMISIILFPLFAVLSLILNLLCIIVIRNEKFTDPLYKYLKFNSIFNAMYCFLMIFRLMTECFGVNSVFCSNIFNTDIVQYFKIYLIFYFGNVLKLLSNITFLSITISRYIMITRKSTKFLFLNSISSAKYLSSIIIFSLVLNLNIIFQYKLNESSPYDLYPININKLNKNSIFYNNSNFEPNYFLISITFYKIF